MNKELLYTLSTGDIIKNSQTDFITMIGVLTLPSVNMTSIKDVIPENWELHKSRLTLTKEELFKLEEYHRKIKEQVDNAKKSK